LKTAVEIARMENLAEAWKASKYSVTSNQNLWEDQALLYPETNPFFMIANDGEAPTIRNLFEGLWKAAFAVKIGVKP
jgi:hypothetical protein